MSHDIIRIDTDHYTATFEPGRCLVRVTLRGIWDVEIARAYEHHFRAALARLVNAGCPLGSQVTLIDLSEFIVQPQEVAAILELFAADQSIAPRRTAMVLSKMLLKLQARRVAPDYATFGDREEALSWLLES